MMNGTTTTAGLSWMLRVKAVCRNGIPKGVDSLLWNDVSQFHALDKVDAGSEGN